MNLQETGSRDDHGLVERMEAISKVEAPASGRGEVKMSQPITEKDGLHKQWYEDAEKQTLESLPTFLKHLTEDYDHDYDTICRAVAAAALGAAHAVDHSPYGGITGFQAGAVMWEFVKHFLHWTTPHRFQDMSDLCYPQYERKFTSIGKETWDWVQERAKEKLKEKENGLVNPDVKRHWESIVAGIVPFGLKVEV